MPCDEHRKLAAAFPAAIVSGKSWDTGFADFIQWQVNGVTGKCGPVLAGSAGTVQQFHKGVLSPSRRCDFLRRFTRCAWMTGLTGQSWCPRGANSNGMHSLWARAQIGPAKPKITGQTA
jgi:hypothetical protein